MELVKCTNCKIDKSKDLFYKDSSKKHGVSSWCKECSKEYESMNKEKRTQWLENNKEKTSLYKKKHYQNNKEKILEKHLNYRIENKEYIKKKDAEYKAKNKETINIKRIEKNKIISLNRKKEKELIRQKYLLSEEYKIKEKERKDKQNNKAKILRKENSLFRLKDNLRARTRKAFRNRYNKKHTSSELLGISYEELYLYIESLFTDGMSWELFGNSIHIDHIIPLSSATNEDELIKLCHYTNLQPLWALDNLRKGDSLNFINTKGTLQHFSNHGS